jgi:hypothetical protein
VVKGESFASLPDLAARWHLQVLTGGADGSRMLAAYLDDAKPYEVLRSDLTLQGRALRLIGSKSGAPLGWVSAIEVFGRVLSEEELQRIWLDGVAALGLTRLPERRRQPAPGVVRIIGKVVSVGGAVAGAKLSAGINALSSNDGSFQVEVPSSNTPLTIQVEKPGFAAATLVAQISEGEISLPPLMLQPLEQLATFSSRDGGTFATECGTSFKVPPDAFIDSTGERFDGQVSLCASVIDPSDESSLAAMPGDFSAVDVSGRSVQLQSFGAMYVGAKKPTGEALRMAEDSEGIEIAWDCKVSMNTCGTEAGMPAIWYFDTVSGKWVEQKQSLTLDDLELPLPGSELAEVLSQASTRPGSPNSMSGEAAELSHATSAVSAAPHKEPEQELSDRQEGAEALGELAAALAQASTDEGAVPRKVNKKLGALGKKKKAFSGSSAEELEQMKQDNKEAQERAVARFLKVFSSAKGQRLKMKLTQPNQWINCDAPYMGCLIKGQVKSRVAHEPWSRSLLVAVGRKYGSRNYASVSASGEFSILVMANMEVHIWQTFAVHGRLL